MITPEIERLRQQFHSVSIFMLESIKLVKDSLPGEVLETFETKVLTFLESTEISTHAEDPITILENHMKSVKLLDDLESYFNMSIVPKLTQDKNVL